MADHDKMHASLEHLQELQSELNNLSKSLEELCDIAHADLSNVGQYWQDGKFEEFSEVYKPEIQKIDELSGYYKQWADVPLQAEIEHVIRYNGWRPESGANSSRGGSVGPVPTPPSPAPKVNKYLQHKNELERPLPPPPQPWPYNQQRSRPDGGVAASPYKYTPPKPDDSGFDTPQNTRPRISPEQQELLMRFYGKQR